VECRNRETTVKQLLKPPYQRPDQSLNHFQLASSKKPLTHSVDCLVPVEIRFILTLKKKTLSLTSLCNSCGRLYEEKTISDTLNNV
jgi:hypothetical protein